MHTDRTIQLDGLRFHYTEWGAPAAPAVIFLHGITGHARTWDDEARLLADRFHVFALDQRGHGDSDPALDGDYSDAALLGDLEAFVEAQHLTRVSLVALSLGGRVAMNYAGRHPDRVERLVVVDIGPDIAPAGRARVGGLMAHAPERFETLQEVVAYQRVNNPRYAEAMLRHRAQHAVRPLPGGGFTWKYDRALRDAIRQDRLRTPADLWPQWRAIRCPTLLVRGSDSDILTEEIAKRMLEARPDARLAVVPGAGHTVPGDQPAAFQLLLREFLMP
ncbi:MAG: alpha/beta hydrolase [Candidatus Rokuibacteriota bacterium]|nr:MAG: alpha/beta hydrolase [Candidatus Rokubacteria bacterium]